VNFLEQLKKCEPNVTQISRDAGLARQAVYLWKGGAIPREGVFNHLKAMAKYSKVLSGLNYKALRNETPYGRKVGSKSQVDRK